jgi:hypothetical protein
VTARIEHVNEATAASTGHIIVFQDVTRTMLSAVASAATAPLVEVDAAPRKTMLGHTVVANFSALL